MAASATREEMHCPDVAEIYRDHADFMFRALHRAGVREADLADTLQEVLMVVHLRRASFDPNASRLTTWLFGICTRVAANQRRKAHVRREIPTETAGEIGVDQRPDPEQAALARDHTARLARILDTMSVAKRVVFVMFELEGKDCAEIAKVIGVPVGTIHSRLHTARAEFKAAMERFR